MSLELNVLLEQACASVRGEIGKGKVANYIPALACVDPGKFGAAVVTVDNRCAFYGDAKEPFSIQSISKVFTLTLALEKLNQKLWERVGVEASGNAFNSILQLESEAGIPRNPFINAGALVLSEVLEVYFHQCALKLSCEQLARASLYLATGGVDPISGRRVVSEQRARRINSIMLTCGHYDASGEFAFRVGLPGKSGVGGGIVAIVPGQAAIAVWSPGLNRFGNSLVGTAALEAFVHSVDWNIF